MTTVLRNALLLTLDSQDHWYDPGYLVLEHDRILEVGPGAGPPGDENVDLAGCLVMPGLVNAHTHSPMVLFRGLAEGHSLLTLAGWYNTIRVWEEGLDFSLLPPAVAVACCEMIRTGTTCFADQYFAMDHIVPVVRRSGLRAALAYGIVELGDAAARQAALAEAETILSGLQGESRLTGWVGPHALFVDNSPAAIAAELDLARRFNTGLHLHLATSGEEDAYCQQHFGRSAVQQMALLGVLDRPVLAAHCLTLPAEDFPLLAGRPFTAVVAASACMRAGAPAAPLRAMLDAGINAALGTDNVANNNSHDLFNEMGILARLMAFREARPAAVSAREIVGLATRGGARALGLEHAIGSLEPGKYADLIALDVDGIGWGPRGGQDPFTALVYATSGLSVREVMVEGQWLLREGCWTTLDFRLARAGLEQAHAALRQQREGAP